MTLTDRYRWLENGKDPAVSNRGAARSMRRRSTISTATRRRFPACARRSRAITTATGRSRRSSSTGASSSSARRRASRRRSSTRGSTASEVLLVDPMAIDPSGKTKIGSVDPESRRDARGGRHLRARLGDPGLPHHRHDDRRADRPAHHRRALVRLGARRGVRVHLAAHAERRTRDRSRIAAIGTSSARTGRPTSC